MKQEDKELLLQDISARLSYKVMCFVEGKDKVYKLKGIIKHRGLWWFEFNGFRSIEAKPYLRPMSSMTDEEREEWTDLFMVSITQELEQYTDELEAEKVAPSLFAKSHTLSIDWLNKKGFDYRGLILKGLAIEVTKENNPYKE